jgi:alpha-tubulin suppressor-like RCC1 family protein
VAVAAGDSYSMALLNNGTVMAWGSNVVGQLGNGTTADSHIPVAVSGLSGVVAIAANGGSAASAGHSLAVLSDGTLKAWGNNTKGEMGIGSAIGPESCGSSPCSTKPVTIEGLTEVTGVSAGWSHTLVVLKSGEVMAWGGNSYGESGVNAHVGSLHRSYAPVAIPELEGVTAVAAGDKYSLALLKGGTVDSWGRNTYGELGYGTEGGKSERPAPVVKLSGVTAISAGGGFPQGGGHSLALLEGGTVMAWGNNGFGELGNGTTTNSDVPVLVSELSGAKGVCAGRYHSLARG